MTVKSLGEKNRKNLCKKWKSFKRSSIVLGFSRDNKKFFRRAIDVFRGAGGGGRRFGVPFWTWDDEEDTEDEIPEDNSLDGVWIIDPFEAPADDDLSGDNVVLAFVISVVMVMPVILWEEEEVEELWCWLLLFWPPDDCCWFDLTDSLDPLLDPFGDWFWWELFVSFAAFDELLLKTPGDDGEDDVLFVLWADGSCWLDPLTTAAPDPDDPVPDAPAADPPPDAPVMVDVAAGGFLVELDLETDPLRPLKHLDNSAAALFVKLTSADIPTTPEPLVALFQAALNTTKKQATFTYHLFGSTKSELQLTLPDWLWYLLLLKYDDDDDQIIWCDFSSSFSSIHHRLLFWVKEMFTISRVLF